MDGEGPTRHRQPWRSAILPAVPYLVAALVWTWVYVLAAAITLLLWVLMATPRSIDLTDVDAVVRANGTVRVPWRYVTDVRPGPWFRGGIVMGTASGRKVWAPTPASWWGGPARPEQVAEIRRWWVDHRGPEWSPPPPGPPPLRTTPPTR